MEGFEEFNDIFTNPYVCEKNEELTTPAVKEAFSVRNEEHGLVNLKGIRRTKIEWLWYPYIPYGKITLVQGDPGDGKSSLVLDLTARLTRGAAMPFTEEERKPIDVIYQNTEDDLSDTVLPRFLDAGGDIEHLHIINETNEPLSLDDKRIEKYIEKTNAKALVLDPLSSYITSSISMNSANEVRAMFNPLIQVAKRTGCAIIIVAHLNKNEKSKLIYRTAGSIDIIGSVRSALLVARRGGDTRVLVHQKSNLAPQGKSIQFTLNGTVRYDCLVDLSAEQLENFESGNQMRNKELEREILELLEEGERDSEECLNHLLEAGYKRNSIFKTKKNLNVVSVRRNGEWFWSKSSYGTESEPDCDDLCF